jgi:PAS domain S-box-containing protein
LIDQTIHHFEDAISIKIKVKNLLLLEKAKGILHTLRIKESQEQYRSLFLFSPLPMWVLDPQTLRFLQVNEAAVLEYGYSIEEFLSIKISDIKFEDDMVVLKENLQKSIIQGNSLKVTTKHRRKNNQIFNVEVRFNIIMFSGREVSLVVLTDITKEVDYINAIECQNQQLRDIAWIQSHSVRKPLANILALSEVIINNPSKLPDIETLKFLRQSANELDQCIREISHNAQIP